jgi:hypothetical protein
MPAFPMIYRTAGYLSQSQSNRTFNPPCRGNGHLKCDIVKPETNDFVLVSCTLNKPKKRVT